LEKQSLTLETFISDWKFNHCRLDAYTAAVSHSIIRHGTIELNELAKRKVRMILLKAPQDQVLAALQAVSGIVQRRHRLPILANVLNVPSRTLSVYEEFLRLASELPSLPRLLPDLPPPPPAFGMVQPPIKLKLGRIRELRGFFGATKVNARNAP
jgi:hypothetical protein